MNMADRLAWGILGAGGIAGAFAKGVQSSKSGTLVAVGSRSKEKAEKFGTEHKIPNRHGSYEALLADPAVKAVYIATPHPQHAEWAIKAARAGKHLLIEKPVALNYAQAIAIFEAAKLNDVFVMEAFMYRCHPQMKKVVELIKEKAIGEVRLIQATFSFHAGFSADSRLFSNELGGGGILDVGCYATSFSRLVAGAAQGKDYADPLEVRGAGFVGTTGVDEWAAATLKFAGNIIAQVATGVSLNQDNSARVYGSEGRIIVKDPWIPARDGGTVSIELHRNGKPVEEIKIETNVGLYGLEADTVAANLEKREAREMSWGDTLGNMKTLDLWRQSIGQQYEQEKADKFQPVPPRKIAAVAGNNMKYGEIQGVGKKISRLVFGADFAGGWSREFHVLADDFFERGGNAFDNSHWYGKADQHLGQWIRSRGVRTQTVVLGKGAHTPYCTPQYLEQQIKESAEKYDGYIDVYAMHRDNPDVPVGEFIDVLNRCKKAGLIKAFGVGNWSLDRLRAANAYAAEKGVEGVKVLSNNFSLARMVNPVWPGCVSASEPEYRAYLKENQIALMPWSSQARGFFVDGRSAPEKKDDGELVNSWYSDDNFKRLERAQSLAKKRGVTAVNIALAYVLAQPFPTFPLVGPRALVEMRTTMPGLDVVLTPDEMKWLNLEV